jgi:hypothetical protein
VAVISFEGQKYDKNRNIATKKAQNRGEMKKNRKKHTLLYRSISFFSLLLPQIKREYIRICRKI